MKTHFRDERYFVKGKKVKGQTAADSRCIGDMEVTSKGSRAGAILGELHPRSEVALE